MPRAMVVSHYLPAVPAIRFIRKDGITVVNYSRRVCVSKTRYYADYVNFPRLKQIMQKH